MRRFSFSAVFLMHLLLPSCLVGQTCPGTGEKARPDLSVKALMEDFTSNHWPRVWTAKLRLESRQAEAIPALLEIVSSDRYLKLQETWDMIYPGASTFYGHGHIVDYDIDWLSVRAGWLLEEITFERFGFSENVIKHDELLQATISGKADRPLGEIVKFKNDLAAKQKQRMEAAERARIWWRDHQANWTRLNAIVEALRSSDPARASAALNWVRNGETRCDGFNRRNVEQMILPEAKKYLNSSAENLREQARLLKEEYKQDWFYKSKTDNACY